jgi:hypothetical protein
MNQYTEDIQHIRKMMERSSQFLSLSGLSGIVSGIMALISAGIVFYIFKSNGINYFDGKSNYYPSEIIGKLGVVAIITLIGAIGTGAFLTVIKLKKKGLPVINSNTRKFLLALFIPLFAGGFFCTALIYNLQFFLVVPSMLIFYGLALVNASKYTHDEIYWLGLIEILLGIIASFFVGYGLIMWAAGFGFMHILYGIILHQKYK